MKIYSASGMAVIVSKVSDAIEPPVVSTKPPSEAEAAILKKTVAASASVCSSKASFWHVIRIRNEKRYSNDFFRL